MEPPLIPIVHNPPEDLDYAMMYLWDISCGYARDLDGWQWPHWKERPGLPGSISATVLRFIELDRWDKLLDMPEEFVSLLTPDTAHTLGDYLQSVVLPEEELEIGKVKVKGMEEARAQDKEKIRLMEEAHAQEKEKMKENTLALVKHAQKLADELSAAKTELEQTKTELEETKAELADVLSVVKTGLAPGPP